MLRTIVALACTLALLAGEVAATTIPMEDLQDFTTPCALNVEEVGPVRNLTWITVEDAVTYKVGYRLCDGTIVGLAELVVTSYEHVGWDALQCLEYVVVAYDLNGDVVCAAHVLNVGSQCPCE